MRKFILYTTFLILNSLITCSFSQNTIRSFITDSLDNYIVNALHDWNVPGLAVCIVKDNQIVVSKGYGVKKMNTNDSVDQNTLFMIGSNTKSFTATALATLAYEKKLSLDDKVTKWIPGFKLEDKLAGEQATIRDLLCHRLGFGEFQGDIANWRSNLSRKEVIANMSQIKAKYAFRTTFGYSNAGFLTAGQIIPEATGLQWEDYLKQKIFEPLGMTRTLALGKDITNAVNKAVGHTIVDGKLTVMPYPYLDNLAPAGSISTSVNDIGKWIIMLLNNGIYKGKEIIPAQAIEATRVPHSITGKDGPFFNKGDFSLYGLGWFLEEYEGRKIVWHSGAATGFISHVTLIPEEKLGIAVLTNTDVNYLAKALRREIVDAYLKLPYSNYSELFMRFDKKNRDKQDSIDNRLKDTLALHLKTELPLQSYMGKYFNEVYGNIEVRLESGELKMTLSHHPDLHAVLKSLGANRFYAIFNDPDFGKIVFPFKVENKNVKSVTINMGFVVEDQPYEFIKQN